METNKQKEVKMQTVTAPNEVVWATRLLWLWLIISWSANIVLRSSLINVSTLVIHILVGAIPLFIIILLINKLLLKGNYWAMWIFVIFLIFMLFLDAYKLVIPIPLTDEEIRAKPLYLIRLIFGLPIIYLLIKQRMYFKTKQI